MEIALYSTSAFVKMDSTGLTAHWVNTSLILIMEHWSLQTKLRLAMAGVLKAHVHPIGIALVYYCLQALLLFSLAV